MNLEILLATVGQKDDRILAKMRVDNDIIVCNQNDIVTNYRIYERDHHKIRWYNFQEKGVGLNRNNALLRATADICLLADDDVVYDNGYADIVLEAFKKNPHADVIIFNIRSSKVKRFVCNRVIKVGMHNYGRFGGARIAFKRTKIIKNAVSFNQLFGGGSMFSAGEDTIFLWACLKKKLKVIAVPDYILSLSEDRDSTWFRGYNKKFFEDEGSLYACIYGKIAYPIAILQLVRHNRQWCRKIRLAEATKYVNRGIKKFKEL